jgi:hypothetical protein
MRITRILATLGMVLLVASCEPKDFLNPLYTTKDLVLDPLLTGAWEQKEEDRSIVLDFHPAAGGCYVLTYTELGSKATNPQKQERTLFMKYDACLVQLGQGRFLDARPWLVEAKETAWTFNLPALPNPGGESATSSSYFHLGPTDLQGVPAGLFITLTPAGINNTTTESNRKHKLHLTPAHWIFRVWFNQTKLRLSDFEPPGDVGTISTEDLQKLVLKYADDTQVFTSFGELNRMAGGSQVQ